MNRFSLILALLAGGCTTTAFDLVKPDGTQVHVVRNRFGADEAVDELTIPTPSGPATLKGGRTSVAPAINDLAATMKNLSGVAAPFVPTSATTADQAWAQRWKAARE